MADSDFYIGYQKTAPDDLAGFVRRIVLILLVVAAGLAAALAALQKPFDAGQFEFGQVRSFEGELRLQPYPMLLVDRPGRRGAATEAVSAYLLVAFGKHGAGERLAALDGRRVSLSGSLIYRDGQTMIELAPDASDEPAVRPLAEVAGGPGVSTAGRELGSVTLRGEIVDSKCYFGVMKPGRSKPHKACATLCISGGIPPVLRTVDVDGRLRHLLLVDEQGGAVNERVLPLVAEPVEIQGRLSRLADLWVLAADPATYRRLSVE